MAQRMIGEPSNPGDVQAATSANVPVAARTIAREMMTVCRKLTDLSCRGLTPKLSRTAARNGGVVHVTM